MVESDESVSNFDPLFTSSDLRDVPFDWSASDDTLMSGSVGHSYNGPGGGISVDRTGKPSSQASGMNIKPTRPGLVPTGSPLTSSVQANFRGFTYTGESMAVSLGVWSEPMTLFIDSPIFFSQLRSSYSQFPTLHTVSTIATRARATKMLSTRRTISNPRTTTAISFGERAMFTWIDHTCLLACTLPTRMLVDFVVTYT